MEVKARSKSSNSIVPKSSRVLKSAICKSEDNITSLLDDKSLKRSWFSKFLLPKKLGVLLSTLSWSRISYFRNSSEQYQAKIAKALSSLKRRGRITLSSETFEGWSLPRQAVWRESDVARTRLILRDNWIFSSSGLRLPLSWIFYHLLSFTDKEVKEKRTKRWGSGEPTLANLVFLSLAWG